MDDTFSVVNKTRSNLPLLPFATIKDDILGKKYSLSLAFLTKEKMREINKAHRNKDKATNVLSFVLTKTSGEILLCPSLIKTETKKFEMPFKQLVIYLAIHGMLHLKGLDHGEKMEKLEKKYLSRTKF